MSETDRNNSDSPPDRETPPWLQPVPEEELQADTDLFKGRGPLLAASGAALALVGLLVAAMLYLYMDDAQDGPPIRVAAPDGPVKERPEERGGMDVANRDKKVFDRAQGRDPASESAATLAPEAEEPVESLPEAQSAPDNTPESAPEGEAESAAPAESTPEQDEAAPDSAVQGQADSRSRLDGIRQTVEEKQAGGETMTGASNDVADRAPTPARKPEAPDDEDDGAAGTEKDDAPALAVDRFRVQLGAYSRRETADNAWAEAQRRFPDALKGLNHAVESVQSGGRTLFRLRAGPLEDRTAADQLCVALRAGQQACIVVGPS
ncbi:SPOR domain-containing protein [Yunchengibacter salinarum]|uniref:SPOR domain-containing protein n=1 Tax=Yunchengibacter salinarum TaxID=3133399 RepID=UPI0035B60003